MLNWLWGLVNFMVLRTVGPLLKERSSGLRLRKPENAMLVVAACIAVTTRTQLNEISRLEAFMREKTTSYVQRLPSIYTVICGRAKRGSFNKLENPRDGTRRIERGLFLFSVIPH